MANRSPLAGGSAPLWAAIAVMLSVLLGCAPVEPIEGDGSSAGLAQIVVGLTVTGAEPAPALPAETAEQLMELGLESQEVGAATIEVVIGSNREQLPVPPEATDLTPMREADVEYLAQVEHIPDRREAKVKQAVQAFEQELTAKTSDAHGLDLLALLEQVGQRNAQQILVISSGVSTVDPLDFRQLGWTQTVASVVQDLSERDLLPRHLEGKSVTFVGLGATAGTQPRLPGPQQKWVEELWLAVCDAAGAQECRLSEEFPPAAPPLATQPVPVVAVPTVDTVTGVETIPAGGCQTVLRVPGHVLFAGNRADLQPAADPTLQNVATEVAAGGTVMEVAGHTADDGDGDGRVLSLQRAQAVAARLIELGVDPSRIKDIEGYGNTRPIEPNFNADGSFNESLAATNRRVEISILQSSC